MTLRWAGASGLPLCLLGGCFTSLGLTHDCPWRSAEMDKLMSLGIVLKE